MTFSCGNFQSQSKTAKKLAMELYDQINASDIEDLDDLSDIDDEDFEIDNDELRNKFYKLIGYAFTGKHPDISFLYTNYKGKTIK